MKLTTTSLFLLLSFSMFAQSTETQSVQLKWSETPLVHSIYPDADTEIPVFKIYNFEGATYGKETPSLPYFTSIFPVYSYGRLQTEIFNEIWEVFEKEDSKDDLVLSENIDIKSSVEKNRLKHFGQISFIPIKKTTNGFERLISFDLRIRFTSESYPNAGSNRTEYTENSVFANADEFEMYKIPIPNTGMYKLDKNYLEGLGINTNNIDPKKIKIYGNGSGSLAELIDQERINDLEENAIKVIGENDGSFDANDAVIFYAEGPHKWFFNENEQAFNRHTNIYSSMNYYYLKIDNSNGLRVSDNISSNVSGETYTTSEFSDYQIYEKDLVNLLDYSTNNHGSGQLWYGDSYKLVREKTYSDIFNFQNITTDSVQFKAEFAGRADNFQTKFSVKIGNKTSNTNTFNRITLSNIDGDYASTRILLDTFKLNSTNPDIEISYPNVGTSEGWLDYMTINARRKLILSESFLSFRDLRTKGEAISKYVLSNAANSEIWDITNPLKAKFQEFNSENETIEFGTSTESSEELKEFIIFNQNGDFITPALGTKVRSQNLHSISDVDMLIVYHSKFKTQAEELADHRNSFSDLDVAIADIDEIYNEFSSGKLDPGAIREMAKMLFERNPEKFKYLLLMGDGSFDARNIRNETTAHNYIPVYETQESIAPIYAFPADDFFGLISEGEGTAHITGLLDIAIGRMPVRTADKAQKMVDKIIRYDTDKEVFGDWRNRVTFVGDNDQGNDHTIDSDKNAERVRAQNKNINLDKIYVDSYQRVATTGDARVPGATDALNNNVFKGQLAIIYLGHGGPGGWTQERMLTKEDIFNWENENKLPIFITATCTFAGFDEPSNVTAGEAVFLNENGGGIALLTTVRPVYSGSNARLTEYTTDFLFQKENNQIIPMGEAMRRGKNLELGRNPRKFLMLGDPAQKLALPTYNVVTTKVNENLIDATNLDTLSALEKVVIEGEIRDNNGQLLNDFNGILYPTIYDKIKSLSTLGQGNDIPRVPYLLRKNIIFKGRVSVTNGKFSFTFIVPKDIDYNYGLGKISYYAKDETQRMDAAGASCDIIIGGIDEDALADNEGPKVELFMNTWEWVNGGMTNENPTLLARLTDDNGINVVGNSIGHDLTGLLNEDSQNSYLLNDFYEAELDDYTSGTIRFPLKNLAEGHHEIKVKAWDISNNSAEGMTDFIVANSAKMALTHVLNYPNPFVNKTCFIFDVNQGGDLDVLVSIYTVSGRLVKTLEETIFNVEQHVSLDNCIEWDGKDDFGDDLATGVYLYKVRVRNQITGVFSDKKESSFEKLVIIK